eukprot:TRINITY_DN10207_c0_g2_i2.p1 TRINITY_DN10207_c0_g2~~TRINITY_DN10207_c0_g2_i2.p1  ORF type:complete len:339 (+),score=49.43 TRINITY_DN10207_c0_g2_i2:63-1079(+)
MNLYKSRSFVNMFMFPAKESSYSPASKDVLKDLIWYSDGSKPMFVEPFDGPGSKTVIFFCHGNYTDIGEIVEYDTVASELAEKTCSHLFAFEYPGYGLCDGRAAEHECSNLAETAYNFLTNELQIHDQQIILVGQSIGSGVACELAQRLATQGRSPRALVLISPFTSIKSMAKNMTSLGALVIDRFVNVRKVSSLTLPTCVAHGINDLVVPYADGVALFDASLGEPKQLVSFEGTHDVFPRDWSRKLVTFINKLSAPQFVDVETTQKALMAKLHRFREPSCDLQARYEQQQKRVESFNAWIRRAEGVMNWFSRISGGSQPAPLMGDEEDDADDDDGWI